MSDTAGNVGLSVTVPDQPPHVSRILRRAERRTDKRKKHLTAVGMTGQYQTDVVGRLDLPVDVRIVAQ